MIWLPEFGVGAVILTNSDSGSLLRSSFRRRLLEVLFDGQPIASDNLIAFAQRARAGNAERREELGGAINGEAVARLVSHYRSTELGTLDVRQENGATWFDFGGWSSEMATRQDENGVTFFTITPGVEGYEFTAAEQAGQRRLVIGDAQHEYVFAERRRSYRLLNNWSTPHKTKRRRLLAAACVAVFESVLIRRRTALPRCGRPDR